MRNEQIGGLWREPVETTVLTDQDGAILDSVDTYLKAGLQLKQWWEHTSTTNSFAERFTLGRTFNRPDNSFGFFDHVTVNDRTIPAMGNFQSMFFDQPKAPTEQTREAAQWMRDQIREFVLHYFMRISDFRQPQVISENGRPVPPPYLRPFSACPQEDPQRVGFGFSQLFYKLRDTGQIGLFPETERFAIVDLREIGEKYEWIVVKVCIFDFGFTYMPFGLNNPQVVLPLSEASYLVLSRDFITHEDYPESGVSGRYGLGYAFIKSPASGLLAYGPGEFDAAFELINFEVFEDGKTLVNMVFVANRPERILNLSLDPLHWGFALADLMSLGLTSHLLAPMQGVLDWLSFRGGDVDPVFAFISLVNVLTGNRAADELCISQEELNRQFLQKHFMQHYQTVVGSLQTWRQIPDWLAGEEQLPQWVVKGISA